MRLYWSDQKCCSY